MIHLFTLAVISRCFSISGVEKANEGILHLKIENIQDASGRLWIGIYDSEENFLIKEKAILKGVEVDHTGTLKVDIDHVKFGTIAVAIMHDVNGNGEMDRNWLGIPTEPYAFSRKPRSKWRLPRFREVVVDFEPQNNKLSVALDRW